MNTNNYETAVVNNGLVYLPRISEWKRILEEGSFLGKKVGDWREWVNFRLEFIKQYPEFKLGLYQIGLEKFGLLPIIILKIKDQLQKVHIERLTCETCGWVGETANPMISDLYGSNWLEETRKAEVFPVLPCPKCDNKLPRNPIWVQALTAKI